MKKILIVDDERENREELAELLRRRYEVVTAPGPAEALEVLDSTFNLVLSDLNMLGHNGIWLAGEIKQKFSGTVPVVIITGLPANISAGEIKDAGIQDVLPKPIDIQKLLDVITRIVEKRDGERGTTEPR